MAAFDGSTPWRARRASSATRCWRPWRVDFQPPYHRVGVLLGAVGEDELASRQSLDGGSERRIGRQRRVVDLMHVVEIMVGIEAVLGHQSAHGRAVALVIILLHDEGLLLRDLQEFGDIGADTVVDLLPEQVMRVKRVVEVEHPGFDGAEAAQVGARR